MKKLIPLLTVAAALIVISGVQAGEKCCATAKQATCSTEQKATAKECSEKSASACSTGKVTKTAKKVQATAKGGYRG